MINSVVIMGRLVADPELRATSQAGTSVCNFTVAVDRIPQKENETDFIPVVAWKQTAEFVSKYFRKGQMIAVDGEIRMRKYTDKDGNNRTGFNINAHHVSFCGGNGVAKNEMDGYTVAVDEKLPFD